MSNGLAFKPFIPFKIMSRLSGFVWLLAAVMCLSACGESGNGNTRAADAPTLTFQPGQVLKYQLQVMQTSMQQALGGAQESGTLTVFDLQFKVLSTNAQGTELDVEFIRSRYAMQNGSENLRYDSQDSLPPDSIAQAVSPYANVTGRHVRVRVSPAGIVDTVMGANEIVEYMVSKLGNVPRHYLPMVRQAIELQFGTASLKKWLQNCFVPLPPENPTATTTWRNEMELPGQLPVATQAQYEMRPDSANLRQIAVRGTIQTDTSRQVEMGGQRFKLMLGGTFAGTLWADSSGWGLALSETLQQLSGKLVTDQGMEVALDTQIEITVRRITE